MSKEKTTSIEVTVKNSEDFCAIWPELKIGLETLESLINNPIAKKAIELVIVTGETISSKTCNI
jgi:hypothetical protein